MLSDLNSKINNKARPKFRNRLRKNNLKCQSKAVLGLVITKKRINGGAGPANTSMTKSSIFARPAKIQDPVTQSNPRSKNKNDPNFPLEFRIIPNNDL